MPVIRATLENGQAVLRPDGYLGGDLFAHYRAAVDGSRFDPIRKAQHAPLAAVLPIFKRLTEAGFQVEIDSALNWALSGQIDAMDAARRAAEERAERVHASLAERGLALYGFQREGVQWLAGRTGALFALDMGLGKTLQSLVAAPAAASARVLVVCPAVAKGVWKDEAAKWRPDLKVTVLSGRGSFRWPEPGELVAVNYDILPAWAHGGSFKAPPDITLIFDEAHACKSYKSTRTKRSKGLAKAVRTAGGRTWALTGTPLLNRPGELFALLELVGEERAVFGSWGKFVELFGGYKDEWGGMHWADTPSAEVPARLARALLRRRRVDVLPDLPGKTCQLVDVTIDSATRKAADQLWKALADAGIALDDAEDLARATHADAIDITTVSKTREALAVAKIPALLDLVAEYEEADEPVVVMSAHEKPVRVLAQREGWARITGAESSEEKSAIVERFQRGELRGVACMIRAAGVGITLTRASHMIFVDRDWTPGLNDQAEDRTNRIGQKNACLYRVLVADHEMDRHVTRLLMKKSRLVQNTVEAASVEAVIPSTDSERALLAAIATDARVEAEGGFTQFGACNSGNRKPRRPASTQLEEWAAHGVRQLAGDGPDGAQVVNGRGFSKVDGAVGHDMASLIASGHGLTDAQWRLVVKLATRYQRQLGPRPEEN